MKIRLLILCITLFFSCGERRFPRPDFEKADFNTTEQAKLFFKNVRAYYYDTDLYSFNGAEVYRWADRERDSTKIWINPVLVVHFLQDKAFILIESSAALKESCKPFLFSASTTAYDSISLEPNAMQEHFNLNVFIYDAIEAESHLYLKSNDGQHLPVLADASKRGSFTKQMRDFLRLVGVI